MTGEVNNPSIPLWVVLVLIGGVGLIALLIGISMGAREQEVRSLTERAALTEQVEVARIAQGRSEERARIAREMHDSLAHDLSLVSLHSGVLELRSDLDSETTRQVAATIQRLAGAATTELREILGVLHSDDPTDRSHATWSRVHALFEDERAAGSRIEVSLPPGWEDSVTGLHPFDALPAAVRQAILRVVGEGLTNARTHGAEGPVDLVISCDDREIGVLLLNEVAVSAEAGMHTDESQGLGLSGLTERLARVGGALEADTKDARFRVQAVVPCPR